MSKCDNCLCNPVCDHNKYGWENCNNFKDKSLFVELPCEVGTPVFFICENEIFEGKIVSFIKQHNVVYVYCRYDIGLTYYHNIEDIGKTVFLTEEQAKAKLKEIERK